MQGHLRAKLDPLGLNPPADVPSLQPGFWGLSEEDLLQEFSVTFGAHTTQMPLKQLLNLLEQAWAGSQAYELAHLEIVKKSTGCYHGLRAAMRHKQMYKPVLLV